MGGNLLPLCPGVDLNQGSLRARHRSVRAKHAAIAGKGLEPFAAPFAVIEELACISRHRLDGLMAAFRASQDGLKLHIGSCFALGKDDGAESCSVPFCDLVLFGIETNNEAWPVPKLNRPVTDKEFSPLDCFGVVGTNQGLEPYKAAVKTNGKSSVFCHRSHPALKTQLAARASRGLYTSEHNSNGIF
jgi:hypothetical protein